MNPCWMFSTPPVHDNRPTIVVRRYAALGDCVAASAVADKLNAMGFRVVWESHPSAHCILRRQPSIAGVREPDGGKPHVNLDRAYEDRADRTRNTFSRMFFDKANADLAKVGINIGPAVNCTPKLFVSPQEKHAQRKLLEEYPRPWVFVCPRSDQWANRTVPNHVWEETAPKIHGTKFWLGWKMAAPPGFVDLKLDHFDSVIIALSVADLLVTVDTGPMHVAAALGIPVVAIGQASSPELHLSDQNDFVTIYPDGLKCLNCQKNICPLPNKADLPPCQTVRSDLIAGWANLKASQYLADRVSAVIPVFGSDPNVIRHCLECVLPQVDEVIITAETADKVPAFPPHEKIKVVVRGMKGIGVGRNYSYGARHSTGKYLLMLNDDVYLNNNAVEIMKREMKPGVGCVSARLMYPDNTVYFAGKVRKPGERGWGHLNHRQHHWDLKSPTELENGFCAASLVSRECFYAAGCFDERIRVYCEDDLLSLQMRRAGYKIMFCPDAFGVHLEHQSTQKLGNIMDLVKESSKIFGEIFGDYFDHNANNSFGDFNY